MSKYFYSLVAAVFLCAFFGQPSAKAQTAKGTVAGTVKDSANSTLIGALVELQPSGRRGVSDDQGQFRIPEVPAGEYTLTASYVGFAAFTTTVKVEAGQTANMEAV